MWQREQKPSSSDPGRDSVWLRVPRSNRVAHSPGSENGLWLDFSEPSGGDGVSHSPCVEVCRADRRNAARHAGSRQAFAIIEPFHSSKIRRWQVWQRLGFAVVCHWSSNGGGKNAASSVT